MLGSVVGYVIDQQTASILVAATDLRKQTYAAGIFFTRAGTRGIVEQTIPTIRAVLLTPIACFLFFVQWCLFVGPSKRLESGKC